MREGGQSSAEEEHIFEDHRRLRCDHNIYPSMLHHNRIDGGHMGSTDRLGSPSVIHAQHFHHHPKDRIIVRIQRTSRTGILSVDPSGGSSFCMPSHQEIVWASEGGRHRRSEEDPDVRDIRTVRGIDVRGIHIHIDVTALRCENDQSVRG